MTTKESGRRSFVAPKQADAEPVCLLDGEMLAQRGILYAPDFVANAGGVICAAVEYHDGTQSQAFATIAEKIRANTAEMLAHMKQQQVLPREAAVQMARRRVEEAMAYHRP